jgi:capsule biosynthesis phosphatase
MVNKTPKIIVDVDDTLTIHSSAVNYEEKSPNLDVITKLKEYKELGYEIILFTSRNVLTFQGDLSKINKHTAPILLKWLNEHSVPYDGVIYGKPWCGEGGFYIDDKAIRPDEFAKMSHAQLKKLIGCD